MAGTESEEDFLNMQQEAIRRVREMQMRARKTLEDRGMHIEPSSKVPQREEAPQPQEMAGEPQLNPNYPHPFKTAPQYNPLNNQNMNQSQSGAQNRQSEQSGSIPNMNSNRGGFSNPFQNLFGNYSNMQNSNQNQQRNNQPNSNNKSNATHEQAPQKESGLPLPLSGLNINLDKDQLMLLGTLYVLFRDGGDPYLMLALAYILFT